MFINKYDLVAIVGTLISALPLSYPLFQAAADAIVVETVAAEAPQAKTGSRTGRPEAAACLGTHAPAPVAADCPDKTGP